MKEKMEAKKALIAMSGGVDSSVAAYLTQKAGYTCIGCTMKLYEGETEDMDSTCCSADDVADAGAVAMRMGFPYYVFNMKEGFYEHVITPFICAYEQGMTPNPCIDCNRYMKFGHLYERANELGCDKIVTGHYARIEEENGCYFLKKALDESKDQSYVLYSMTQEQLSHTLFPLGNLKKSETRQIATEQGFVNADKADSQDICFVPDGDYASVIERYTGKCYEPGDFVTEDGRVLGRHRGIIHYTVGQRKGLGISAPEPLYVKRLDVARNRVVLSSNAELFERTVHVGNFNWISGQVPKDTVTCKAKIRYRHREEAALAWVLADGSVAIRFEEPQRAITPGQSAVLYDGDRVLGGGIILGTEIP